MSFLKRLAARISKSKDCFRKRTALPRKRRVSISELPRLPRRLNYLEIELYFAKLYLRHFWNRTVPVLRRVRRGTVKALRWLILHIILLPWIPTTLFFILADWVVQKIRSFYEDMDTGDCSALFEV